MQTHTLAAQTTKQGTWLALGGLATALGASLCCILPVVVAVAGVGSVALGAQLEPWRPYFATLTVLLLGFAFYRAYRPRTVDCEPGQSCAVPENRMRQRLLLWVLAALALTLFTFPYYAAWIL